MSPWFRALMLALMLATAAGCAQKTLVFPATIPNPQANQPKRPPPPPPPPPHPEFGQLRPHHNYYRVISVGPYREHFVVSFHKYETVTATYQADPADPDAPVVQMGQSFGFFTKRVTPSSDLSPALAANVEAIKADLRQKESPQGDIDVRHMGTFRAVVIEEIVARQADHPRSALYNLRTTLKVDKDLTEVQGQAPFYMGMGGSVRLDDRSGFYDQTNWIDAGLGFQGFAQLWKFYRQPHLYNQQTQDRFEAELLKAAAHLTHKTAGPTLAQLASEQDTNLLPADLETRRPFIFYVNAVENGRRQSSATSWIMPARAFGGREETRMKLSIPTARHGDVIFDTSVVMHAAPLAPGLSGDQKVPFTLDYSITSNGVAGSKPIHGTIQTQARIIIDGPRIHFIGLDDGIPAQNLPGVEPYRSFELHLGFMGVD